MVLYVLFVLDERECIGDSWIGDRVCGDSYVTIAVCVLVAGAAVWGVNRLVRRVRRR